MSWDAPLYLKAPDEATLAAALPMLRAGGAWIMTGPWHSFGDAIPVPVIATPAVMADDHSGVATPAVMEAGFHADLRLDPAGPDYAAIMAACAPYAVTPAHPQRVWA